MKSGRWVLVILMAFAGLVRAAPLNEIPDEEDDIPLELPTTDEVQAHPDDWWSTGLLVGTVPSKEWVEGIIFTSGEIQFNAVGGIKRIRKSLIDDYPVKEFRISVQDSDKDLWGEVEKLKVKRPVVLRYRYPFYAYVPFSTDSRYILEDVLEPDLDFTASHSYKHYPQGVEWKERKKYIVNGGKTVAGVIVQVERTRGMLWGAYCSVDIHFGGTKNIAYFTDYYDRQLVSNDKNDGYHEEYVSRTLKTYRAEPNIGRLITYSESMCQYAEDAARTLTEVDVTYSRWEESEEELLSGTLYKIQMTDQDEGGDEN